MVVLRFNQQMQMITLDRVVHDTKAMPDTGCGQRCSEPAHEPWPTQGRDAASQSDRHVHRNTCGDGFALPMHDARSFATRPTRTVTWPTTTRVVTHRIERQLFELSHL